MIEPGKTRLGLIENESEMYEVVQYIYNVLDNYLGFNLDAVLSNINEIYRQAGPSLLNGGEFEKAMGRLNKQHWLIARSAAEVFVALYKQTKIGKEPLK